MNSTTSTVAQAPHGYEHRERVTRALVGVYTSLEHQAAPHLSGDNLSARARQRAAHAYDQLAQPRVGQLLPNMLGRAVLVTTPDGR